MRMPWYVATLLVSGASRLAAQTTPVPTAQFEAASANTRRQAFYGEMSLAARARQGAARRAARELAHLSSPRCGVRPHSRSETRRRRRGRHCGPRREGGCRPRSALRSEIRAVMSRLADDTTKARQGANGPVSFPIRDAARSWMRAHPLSRPQPISCTPAPVVAVHRAPQYRA